MLVKAQYRVSLERYETEKEIGDEKRFLGFVENEVKHNLSKEIIKQVEVKETTEKHFEGFDEIYPVPIEEARSFLGYLMFESEIIVVSEKEKEELQKALRLLYNSQLTEFQRDQVKKINKILVEGI